MGIPSYAQFQGGGSGEGGQQLICRGDRDFSTFMSSILSYDGFIEYWKDILVRYNANICLYEDIDSLFNRIKKVRTQIRKAFYACADEDKVAKLKNTYYELETKLFFLRKYIEVSSGNFIVRNDADVINEFRKFFVFNRGLLTDDKVMELYNKFKTEYGPRMKTYQDCTDSTWQQVIDKWNEFYDTAGGITPALKEAKKSTEKRWSRLSKAANNGWGDFSDRLDVLRINGLPAEEGLGQILEELEKNLPGGVSFSELQAATSEKQQERDYTVLESEYLSQYELLYKESSDEITRQIDSRLNKLNRDIIEASFPYQNQTINCVSDINNQQC